MTIISAAMTRGIHPQSVSMNTIRNEPHPLSTTARGGNSIAIIALKSDMSVLDYSSLQTYIKKRILQQYAKQKRLPRVEQTLYSG